jgi:hypothetical protein
MSKLKKAVIPGRCLFCFQNKVLAWPLD